MTTYSSGGFEVLWQKVINAVTFLEFLLHLNQKLDTINYLLNQLNLGGSESVQVGYIKQTSFRSSVYTTSSTLL